MFWIFPFWKPILGLAWFSVNILLYRNWLIKSSRVNQNGRIVLKELDHQSKIQNFLLFCAFTVHIMISLNLLGVDELGQDMSRSMGIANFLEGFRPHIYPDFIIYILEEKFSLVLGTLMAVSIKKNWVSMQSLFFVAFVIMIYSFAFRREASTEGFQIPEINTASETYKPSQEPYKKQEPSDFYKDKHKKRDSETNNDKKSSSSELGDVKGKEKKEESSIGEFIFEVIVFILEAIL